MPTTSMSLPRIARNASRPMRPKPLIPILTAMRSSSRGRRNVAVASRARAAPRLTARPLAADYSRRACPGGRRGHRERLAPGTSGAGSAGVCSRSPRRSRVVVAARAISRGGARCRRRIRWRPGASSSRALEAPLAILRDRAGVPHVRAASERDAYFGLGFAHAQDRPGAARLAAARGARAASPRSRATPPSRATARRACSASPVSPRRGASGSPRTRARPRGLRRGRERRLRRTGRTTPAPAAPAGRRGSRRPGRAVARRPTRSRSRSSTPGASAGTLDESLVLSDLIQQLRRLRARRSSSRERRGTARAAAARARRRSEARRATPLRAAASALARARASGAARGSSAARAAGAARPLLAARLALRADRARAALRGAPRGRRARRRGRRSARRARSSGRASRRHVAWASVAGARRRRRTSTSRASASGAAALPRRQRLAPARACAREEIAVRGDEPRACSGAA